MSQLPAIHPLPRVQAVVLTGGRPAHQGLLAGHALQSKALLPVLGQSMIAYVLAALASSRFRPERFVSANDLAVKAWVSDYGVQALPGGASAVASLTGALACLPHRAEWVLFASGDHPLLSGEMIDYFLREAMRRELAFGAAVVERAWVKRRYPQSRRTYFHAKNGAYSGGNLFLVHPRTFQGSSAFMERMDANRKNPWKNVALLPLGDMAPVLLRQWNIHEVARRASGVFGCRAGVVEMPFAECCMDVDKPDDLAMAEAILQARQEARALLDPSRLNEFAGPPLPHPAQAPLYPLLQPRQAGR